MKKFVLLAVGLALSFCAKADINKPDFAYPRQVISDANAAFVSAQKANDGIGMLQAVMQMSVAKNAIDNDSLQYSAKQVLALAKEQKDRQIKSLFDLYAASLIKQVYAQRSYVYNRRDLPLYPRPDDMTEWSGKMFSSVIDSLCEVSWSNAGDMPISELTRVIDADELCQRYYPTLADFVASMAIGFASNFEESKKAEILALHSEPSAPWYNWKIRLDGTTLSIKDLLNMYDSAPAEYKSNAGIVFQYIKDHYPNIDTVDRLYDIKKYVATITNAQKELTNTWAEGIVTHLLNVVNNPTLRLSINKFVVANEPFDLNLTAIRNVDKLIVKVLKSKKVIETKEFAINHNSVEKGDTIVQIQLPTGKYELQAYISEKQVYRFEVYSTRAIPVALSAQDMNAVHVIDTKTGESLPNIPITVTSNKKAIATVITNAQGIAKFSEPISGGVSIKIDGETLDFSQLVSLEKVQKDEKKNNNHSYDYSFTSDMPIYKPGDTVNWSCVITADNKVQPGLEQGVKLYSCEDLEDISKGTYVSDEYGRITGQFKIPEDVKLGMFAICTDNDESLYDFLMFEVSDFKPAPMHFTKFSVWPHKAESKANEIHHGTAVISGVVENYANFGIDNATVECVVNANETATAQGKTDANGAFEISVPYSYVDEDDSAHVDCFITAADGTAISTSKWFSAIYPYKISANNALIKRAYDTRDSVSISIDILDPEGNDVALPIHWAIIDNASNDTLKCGVAENAKNISMDLSNIKAGEYCISLNLLEPGLAHEIETSNFYLYNSATNELPTSELVWVKDTNSIDYNNDGKTISITIGVSDDNTTIYAYADMADARYNKQTFDAGYHTMTIDLSEAKKLGERLRLYAVHNGKIWTTSFNLPNKVNSDLIFSTESFRDKIYADTPEQWHFSVTDKDGAQVSSAMVLTMYDKRLEQFSSQTTFIEATVPSIGSLKVSYIWQINGTRYISTPYKSIKYTELSLPSWLYESSWRNTRGFRRLNSSLKTEAATFASDDLMASLGSVATVQYEVEDSAEEEVAIASDYKASSGSDNGNDTTFNNISLRNTDNYLAFWKPDLVSDKDGNYDISFVTPNANTTWILHGCAWTKDCKSVNFSHEFVASKPIMVSTNAPRFVRSNDKAIIGATVMNNSDTVQHIKIQLHIDADTISTTPIVIQSKEITLSAGQSDVVFITLDASKTELWTSGNAYITAKVSNGTFSDGERVSIPVLPSQTLVVNSENFYLNPGDKTYSTDISHPAGSDSSSTLTFTENAMWTVVESLPLLTSDDNLWNCVFCQSAAFFASSIALGLQKEHNELELQFNIKDMQQVQKNTLQYLIDMQLETGAWRWCKWDTLGSLFTTSKILSHMATLKRSGYLPNNQELNKMIERALKYSDSRVKDTDLQYTIYRSAFPDVTQSLNGKCVSDATVQWINKNWKKMGISTKALAATALQYTNNKNMAKTLISSLDEFGTQTKSKGFEFMNVRNLSAYANLLHAYSAITPKSEHVDGLRQYLIMNKQATDWGNYTTTSDVVASMINSGTKWTVPAKGATVSIDGTPLDVQSEGRMGTLTTNVTGSHLDISVNGDTPAYGAVITRYNAPMKDVEAYSDGEISIEKNMYVLRSGKWETIDSLRVGDKVKISLTVKASRPFSELIITDDRAATFMPTEQLATFTFAGGFFAYRENRNSATNLYINYLPKGTHIIDYEMTVNNAGEFASGIATATCTQAPELTAHSAGTILKVLPQY
jgi:hypothetical protein